jgi:hypothetical protein
MPFRAAPLASCLSVPRPFFRLSLLTAHHYWRRRSRCESVVAKLVIPAQTRCIALFGSRESTKFARQCRGIVGQLRF